MSLITIFHFFYFDLILLDIIICNKIYIFKSARFHYKLHPLETISSHRNSSAFSPSLLFKSPLGLIFSTYCLYTVELFLLILSKNALNKF